MNLFRLGNSAIALTMAALLSAPGCNQSASPAPTEELRSAIEQSDIEQVRAAVAQIQDLEVPIAIEVTWRFTDGQSDRVQYTGTFLHLAVSRGFIDALSLLLERGARHDSLAQPAASQPLHWAAALAEPNCVRALIDAGADVTATNADGATALMVAARHGNLATVNLLLERGSDVQARTIAGWTALHSASWEGHAEIVSALLGRTAAVNARDQDGQTPLYVAARNGHGRSVELLLEAGAFLNATDKEGWSPLSAASWFGHIDVVKFLVAKGAELNARTIDGTSSLSAALSQGHEEVAAYLENQGAN